MISRRLLLAIAAVAAIAAVVALRALGSAAGRADAMPAVVVATLAPVVTPPSPVESPVRARGLGVAAVEGVAERYRGADHQPIAVGDVIEGSDWITTERNASLRLDGESGTSIQVGSSSRVRLDETRGGKSRLTLDHGRVRATSNPGGAVAVRAADGSAAVEGADADFTMQAEPGVVRVVPHRNRVTLIARDDQIEVEPGNGAVVAGRHGPVLSKLPRSLLLKVRWPAAGEQRETLLRVEGETAPGAVVRAGAGAEVVADLRGRFAIAVPLRDGQNHPRLTAEDLAGRRVASTGQPLVVDRNRPKIEHGGVRYQ